MIVGLISCFPAITYSPKLPPYESIPNNIPNVVHKEIEKLYSESSPKQAEAVHHNYHLPFDLINSRKQSKSRVKTVSSNGKEVSSSFSVN